MQRVVVSAVLFILWLGAPASGAEVGINWGASKQSIVGFGGAMGLLGKFGATMYWGASLGGFTYTTSWNMIRALGRSVADPDRTFIKSREYTGG